LKPYFTQLHLWELEQIEIGVGTLVTTNARIDAVVDLALGYSKIGYNKHSQISTHEQAIKAMINLSVQASSLIPQL